MFYVKKVIRYADKDLSLLMPVLSTPSSQAECSSHFLFIFFFLFVFVSIDDDSP